MTKKKRKQSLLSQLGMAIVIGAASALTGKAINGGVNPPRTVIEIRLPKTQYDYDVNIFLNDSDDVNKPSGKPPKCTYRIYAYTKGQGVVAQDEFKAYSYTIPDLLYDRRELYLSNMEYAERDAVEVHLKLDPSKKPLPFIVNKKVMSEFIKGQKTSYKTEMEKISYDFDKITIEFIE